MSNLTQERIAKPKSDDMSMDEILASIRKIISSSDENNRLNKDSNTPHSNTPQKHFEKKNDMNSLNDIPHQPLSAREQLLSLTKPDLYDTDFTKHKINPKTSDSTQFKRTLNPNVPPKKESYNDNVDDLITEKLTKQKPVYQKLSQEYMRQSDIENDDDTDNLDNIHDNHDADILRALNEIRETLSATSLPKKTDNHNSKTDNDNLQKKNDDNDSEHNTNTNTINDIDLKPVQFTGDAVPEFLKKFKRQQQFERERNKNSPNNSIDYSFSKLPNFDEGNDIVHLTEKVMPMSKQDLQQENIAKTNISKLRENTQEIMRRATERYIDDTLANDINNNSNDDLSETDSSLSDLIVRTLKPMLQEWINENMQNIAEQVLRQEFRRGLR